VVQDEVEIVVVRASSPEAAALVAAYFAELDGRLSEGFDPERSVPAPPAELDPPDGRFVVVRVGGRSVGCGGVRRLGEGVAEVKRMWIEPGMRSLGLGRRLLGALEDLAAEALGCSTVRLDTSDELREALRLYRAAGYQEIAPYNDNAYATRWFEKQLRPGGDDG